MRVFGVILSAIILVTGCVRNQNEHAVRYHDDGRAKPIVSLVPVFEQSSFDFPWSLSDEFTTDVYNKLVKKDKLFLRNQPLFSESISKEVEPFGKDLAFTRKLFEGSEYVILMEIVDHFISPSKTKESEEVKTAQNLDLTMRVRVIDLRESEPKVILQEMIHQSHHIPKFLSEIDYTKCRWGTKRFNISPVGIAHRHFIKEISNRLEDYIMLSQSH